MGSIPAWRTKINKVKELILKSTQKFLQINNNIKIYAILCYIPFLCIVPLLKLNKLDDFSKKHAKQGLLLLLAEFISLLFLIDFVSNLFWSLALIFCLIIGLIGIVKAASNKTWKIPVIGNIFEKYDI